MTDALDKYVSERRERYEAAPDHIAGAGNMIATLDALAVVTE